jgi:4-amino-4-deoxy-L-arabinose transferase-like glycosyltransferase
VKSVAARLLLLLLPIAFAGLFARVLYTPDEPREASLVVSMAHQADKSLPALGGHPFAEKPPLLYWFGGAAVALGGASAPVMRLPNLLYLGLAVLAIVALLHRAAGEKAAFAAGVFVVTSLQLYQVLIWLATDAPLLSGVAVSLLGCYRGLTGYTPSERRVGYAIFHAGLLIAFFAKGFAGWMVPVLALLSVIVLERRWAELRSSELWIGVPVVLAVIGAWVLWVARAPEGVESL